MIIVLVFYISRYNASYVFIGFGVKVVSNDSFLFN